MLFVLVLSACGSDATPVSAGAGEELPLADDDAGPLPVPAESDVPADGDTIPVEPDVGEDDAVELLPEETDVPDIDETVITDDDIVDPRVTAPTEVLLNPDDPTELWVRFVGGDPNCTAASGTLLTETPDEIAIELLVGITQDALARSCVAGEFNLRVNMALNESGEGKPISWAQPAGEEAPFVTPELSTDDFVGLSQADAAALADENLIPNRIGRIDGEFFALTEDFNPGRLTFEIDGDVVSSAVLG